VTAWVDAALAARALSVFRFSDKEARMERKMADCRRFESDSRCQLTIIGPEDDVVAAAVQHAVASHGHEDTPELREGIRGLLEDESAYVPGEREPVPFPG
jgi:hypothetical protein